MATKSITVTEGAYKRLALRRIGKESFSDIINRITQKQDLMQYAGILSHESAERMRQHIRKRRAKANREAARRRKKLVKRFQGMGERS